MASGGVSRSSSSTRWLSGGVSRVLRGGAVGRSMAMAAAMASGTVPLGVLLRREVTNERMERPDVLCGEASRSRKGEDFTLLRADAGQRVHLLLRLRVTALL
uniref:Uncharacterized protein n=1 Tax=Arundo donax TaxID=35708 RepID=A0A0A9CXJ3_ARUDO